MEELERLSVQDFKEANKLPIVVILDEVRSMHNVGSVFRTADSFRIEKIYLCGLTPCPPHRDIQKTALGATESVSWQHSPVTTDLIQSLKLDGFEIYAIEQVHHSIALHRFEFAADKKVAFVFGHEALGVSEEVIARCDGAIEIPQLGTKHSLNISVSAGIVLWEMAKRYL